MSERIYRVAAPKGRSGAPPFLTELNEAQRAAATAPDGPTLVIAGAGSGKTRTLAYRVAWLLSRGVPPEQVLLLTFTNRAAREMVARVEELLGAAARRVCGGTFHSVGLRLLRRHASTLGYQDGFTVIDPEDASGVMRASLSDVGLVGTDRRYPRAKAVARALSRSINTGEPFAELFARRHPQFSDLLDRVSAATARFVERKVELNVLDFDDLLLGWRLLLEDEDTAARIRGLFRHVLVDEYQDTNWLQGDLVDQMSEGHSNVTVVGDDCQTIYSFRGASFENILGFPDRHAGCSVFRLEDNYRSTPQILALANRSIRNNARQFEKTLRPTRREGEPPAVIPCSDALQQASFVATRVLELREEGTPLSEQAVLYRAHRHAAELEVELRRRQIPYVVRSGLRFFEQAHIKDVLAWLRIASNRDDALAWRRVLMLQPGLGEVATGAILAAMETGDPPALRGRSQGAWERVRVLFERVQALDVRAALLAVLEGGYAQHLRDRQDNARERIEDIKALAGYAASYDDVQSFLDDVSGVNDVVGQGFQRRSAPSDDEHLVLSTVHQAKGLEWQAVFVVGLAEGLFPLPWAAQSPIELEEERRLFYVAATRARTDLHLVYPVFGVGGMDRAAIQQPSRFLQELQGPGREPVYATWRVEEAPAEDAP